MKALHLAKSDTMVAVGGVLFFLATLVLGGCASQPTYQKARTINQVVEDGDGPLWLVKKGKAFSGDRKAFYGVGTAGRIVNPALRRRAAEAQARRDVASQFQVYVAALQKQYLSDITAGSADAHSEEQVINDTMKELTEATLTGVNIEEYWEHPDRNEAYALARLDLDQFLEKVQSYNAANDQYKELSEKIRERVKQDAKKAFDDLQEALDKRHQGEN